MLDREAASGWMGGMKRMAVLLGVLAVAGCYHYEPRVSVDAVNKRNAKHGLDWFSSPVRRPFQIREAIRSCVKSKGYSVAG